MRRLNTALVLRTQGGIGAGARTAWAEARQQPAQSPSGSTVRHITLKRLEPWSPFICQGTEGNGCRDAGGPGQAAAGAEPVGRYEQVASFHGHSDSVLRVAWAPDGALLASGVSSGSRVPSHCSHDPSQ